jgi:hypothetical protein
MRKSLVIAVVAWCAGFLVAAVTGHAYTKLNAWRAFGEQFQLGYVVGYIDAVKLAKFKDLRATIPTMGRARYKEWQDGVNEFYEDPANADRPVPDAMLEVGRELQDRILKAYRAQREAARESATAPATPAPE